MKGAPMKKKEMEATIEFFRALTVGGDGLLELRPLAVGTFRPTGRLYVDLNGSTEPLAKFLQERHRDHNYFAMALRRDRSSGTLNNCTTLSTLYADIDFKHVDTPEATARERLATCPLTPSIVVHSGGGLHVYWLLRESLNLQDPTDREQAYALLARL
jgi:hypothetical protein